MHGLIIRTPVAGWTSRQIARRHPAHVAVGDPGTLRRHRFYEVMADLADEHGLKQFPVHEGFYLVPEGWLEELAEAFGSEAHRLMVHILPGSGTSLRPQEGAPDACKRGHEFTEANTAIRDHGRKRECRTCLSERNKAKAQRAKALAREDRP